MRKHLITLLAAGVLAGAPFEALFADSGSPLQGYALDNGDMNGDGYRDLADGIYLLQTLFVQGVRPVPLAFCGGEAPAVENGDTNGDEVLSIADAIRLIAWLFTSRHEPVKPCGEMVVRAVPPQAEGYGRTYGEWAAAWWQWALGAPAAVNPLIDPTGEFCDGGQEGPVWFLAGNFGVYSERACTVPPGKALFFPVVNYLVSPLFGDGETEEQIRASANAYIDNVTALEATVDGVSIENLDPFRAESPAFAIELPEGDLIGMGPGVIELALTDGYWILLGPLPAGDHVVRFRGEVAGGFPDGFETEVVYSLTVAAP
jgi:hypothetical protein